MPNSELLQNLRVHRCDVAGVERPHLLTASRHTTNVYLRLPNQADEEHLG